jgi:hypothetical protein
MPDAEGPNLNRDEAVDGFESTDAIDGCVVSITGLESLPFAASDVYITATLVDGEFIVPVKDHPIAA